jgi:selenocysteine lyase/cysteine desulfurase
MPNVAGHEAALLRRVTRGLDMLPGVDVLSMWGPSSPRVGIVAFQVQGWHPSALATALSAEHGIGVRDGSFCAHPLVAWLGGSARDGATADGAVRATFPIRTRERARPSAG